MEVPTQISLTGASPALPCPLPQKTTWLRHTWRCHFFTSQKEICVAKGCSAAGPPYLMCLRAICCAPVALLDRWSQNLVKQSLHHWRGRGNATLSSWMSKCCLPCSSMRAVFLVCLGQRGELETGKCVTHCEEHHQCNLDSRGWFRQVPPDLPCCS